MLLFQSALFALILLPLSGNSAPVSRRQYAIAFHLYPVVDDQVAKWLQHRIIEPAAIDCPYNSSLLCVPKKDLAQGKTDHRVCIDPRHINVFLQASPFKTPLIQDIFNALSGSRFFSTLDYMHSFHQWPLLPAHRHKTCFTWRSKRYQFRGAPFGLAPLTGHIQNTQDQIFKDCPFAHSFVDDLIVHSNTLEEHLEHLRYVLQQINKFNLKIRYEKCVFIASELILLGHKISFNSIAIDPSKLINLQAWPTPTSSSAVASFLGFCNYFRNFIPLYATLAAPLESIRASKLKSLTLSPAQARSFDLLKSAISAAPILHLPDFALPFYVATDASLSGIGTCLYQIVNSSKRFVQFQARSLSPSERNYSATKRELLAIVFALKKFHFYLYHSEFTLFTDHRALTYLFLQRHTNSMILNWFETLLTYRFKIIHLPGPLNVIPDLLSRIFSASPLSAASASLSNSPSSPDAPSIIDSLCLPFPSDPVRFTPDPDDRPGILERAHLAGHFGWNALFNSIRLQNFDWPGLASDCQATVKSCTTCHRFVLARRGYHPLTPIHADLPFDHVAIDLFGPLPTSSLGYNFVLIHVDVYPDL